MVLSARYDLFVSMSENWEHMLKWDENFYDRNVRVEKKFIGRMNLSDLLLLSSFKLSAPIF